MDSSERRSRRSVGRPWILLMSISFLALIGYSAGQALNPLYLSGFPAAQPLVDHKGQYHHQLSQQVIVPGGFQNQHQISGANFPRSFDTRRTSRIIPSIQNGHFQLKSAEEVQSSANLRPSYASIGTGTLSTGRAGGARSLGATSSAANANDNREIQYEYYDDEGNVEYAYSNEDSAGQQQRPSSLAVSNSAAKKTSRPNNLSLRPSNEQPSSFISLDDDDEAPIDPSLALNGRSVRPQLPSRNLASNPTPLPSLLRNSSIVTRSKSAPPSPPAPPSSSFFKRPAVLRGPVNRFDVTPKPPQPPQLSREASDYVRGVQIPTSRAVGNIGKIETVDRQQLSPSPSSEPSEEEYLIEEYPAEYYEEEDVSEAPRKSQEAKQQLPETKTKVTVSVSTKTKTTSAPSTPSPLERPKGTRAPGVVISVATTRSIHDGAIQGGVNNFRPVTEPPANGGVTTPKVTFSRATGSSIVVASVQTSRSVATPSSVRHISSQHPPQASSKGKLDSEYYEEEYTYPDSYVLPTGSAEDGKVGEIISKEKTEEAAGGATPSSKTTSTTTTTTTEKTEEPTGRKASISDSASSKSINIHSIYKDIKFKDDVSAFLPPEYRVTTDSPLSSTLVLSSPPTTSSSTTDSPTSTTTTKTSTSTTTLKPDVSSTLNSLLATKIKFEEASLLPSLLPKDYKRQYQAAKEKGREAAATTSAPVTTTTSTTTTSGKPNLLNSLFSKVKFEDSLAGLLPPGYDPAKFSPESEPSTTTSSTTSTTTKAPAAKTGLEGLIQNIQIDDIRNFLPPGYKLPSAEEETKPSSQAEASSSTLPTTSTTQKSADKSLNKLVYPTRPGGLKAARPSTSEAPKAESPPPPKVTIQAGWPTRKTTEFTGWPTSSTQRTTTTSTTTTTTTTTPMTTTTTTRPTTSRIPPKQSPLSVCRGNVCRWEAVMRVVGQRWVPELATKNTVQWKQLERDVKNSLDQAYKKSNLADYYRSVEIEAFTEGIIVDYFVNLVNVTNNMTSANLQKIFHSALPRSDHHELPNTDDADLEEETEIPRNERLQLGRFYIDPSYTDFKVRNETNHVLHGSAVPEGPLPQWAIAVIVIGLASLMFVVIFGVTVLVSRHKSSKKKNAVSLTQEMLNEFNKSHLGGVDNYGADDLYNMDDVWADKQQHQHMERTYDRKPGKRASSSGKGSANYNIYDSWKTEWNGYYYNGNYYGDSGYAPTRRRSDYDTNF